MNSADLPKPPSHPAWCRRAVPPCDSPSKLQMTIKHIGLQEDTHFRVLRVLQDNPELPQRELAEAVGVNVGGDTV